MHHNSPSLLQALAAYTFSFFLPSFLSRMNHDRRQTTTPSVIILPNSE